jgi:hypothetical protein
MRLLVARRHVFGEEETGYRSTKLSLALQTGAAGSTTRYVPGDWRGVRPRVGHAQEAISTSSPSFERACGQPLGDYLKHQ